MDVKTIVIIEHAHCGTTMLAGMLEIAGAPMVGDNYKEMKWEDQEVIRAMRSSEEEFAKVVNKRNQEHDVWGFKSPGAWHQMDLLVKYLRNPIFLAIYKDPVSVSLRRARRRKGNSIRLVLNTVNQYSQSLTGMCNTKQPIYLFSYLKAIIDPDGFVQELLDVTGLEVDRETKERLIAFIQPNKEGPRVHYPEVKSWI